MRAQVSERPPEELTDDERTANIAHTIGAIHRTRRAIEQSTVDTLAMDYPTRRMAYNALRALFRDQEHNYAYLVALADVEQRRTVR